jgi:hypothetical protein
MYSGLIRATSLPEPKEVLPKEVLPKEVLPKEEVKEEVKEDPHEDQLPKGTPRYD